MFLSLNRIGFKETCSSISDLNQVEETLYPFVFAHFLTENRFALPGNALERRAFR
jgi:hypothetical protein